MMVQYRLGSRQRAEISLTHFSLFDRFAGEITVGRELTTINKSNQDIVRTKDSFKSLIFV